MQKYIDRAGENFEKKNNKIIFIGVCFFFSWEHI